VTTPLEDGGEKSVSANADIAQLVEQVIRNDQVVGSNPTIGSNGPMGDRSGRSCTLTESDGPVGRPPTGTDPYRRKRRGFEQKVAKQTKTDQKLGFRCDGPMVQLVIVPGEVAPARNLLGRRCEEVALSVGGQCGQSRDWSDHRFHSVVISPRPSALSDQKNGNPLF
jgi:hypothetical protein